MDHIEPFNYVVLQHLSEFVSCEATINSCRSVNRLWYEGFKKKAMKALTYKNITISPSLDIFGRTVSTPDHDSAVSVSYAERVRIENLNDFMQQENILNLLVSKGDHLKYLCLKGTDNDSNSLQFADNILWKWCKNLEELRLVKTCHKVINGTDSLNNPSEIRLKKIVLDYKWVDSLTQPISLQWITKIIRNAKQLDSFSYFGYLAYYWNPSGCFFFSQMMKEICSYSRNLRSLEFHEAAFDGETLSIITNSGLLLQKFVFVGHINDEFAITKLNMLLRAYSGLLKYLHLDLDYYTSHEGRREKVELNVHELINLETLKIHVGSFPIWNKGLLGNLQKLEHLTLLGRSYEKEIELENMFAKKGSKSLKTICLKGKISLDCYKLQHVCPNVKSLHFACLPNRFSVIITDLASCVGGINSLEDLTIFISLSCDKDDKLTDTWSELLFSKLSLFKLRILHITGTPKGNVDLPWIRMEWILNGLLVNRNTFFCIEFKRFNIRVDEVQAIIEVLVKRANFVKFIECNIIAFENKSNVLLKCLHIFQENAKDVIKDIFEQSGFI